MVDYDEHAENARTLIRQPNDFLHLDDRTLCFVAPISLNLFITFINGGSAIFKNKALE